jgi:hypothetical protein
MLLESLLVSMHPFANGVSADSGVPALVGVLLCSGCLMCCCRSCCCCYSYSFCFIPGVPAVTRISAVATVPTAADMAYGASTVVSNMSGVMVFLASSLLLASFLSCWIPDFAGVPACQRSCCCSYNVSAVSGNHALLSRCSCCSI